MAVSRCSQGHYYDDQKFSRCPHCGIFTSSIGDKEEKVQNNVEDFEKTMAFKDVEILSKEDDVKTIGIYSKVKGNDFVTGWLVCVNGLQRGRDYRLYHGFNRIGRGCEVTICIEDDKAISRECHCSIVYDAKLGEFSLVPSSGAITYKNGNLVQTPELIKTRDLIEIGESEFEFIAFCGEGRVWENL